VHLVYIDEVKYDRPVQPYHWLGALAFPEDSVQDIDERLSKIALDYFGTSILEAANEFHGSKIIQRKGPYRNHPMPKRIALYMQLIDAIDETPDLGRIEIRINPGEMKVDNYQEFAFMFLIEKVNDYMAKTKSLALLIADHDKEFANTNVRRLSEYKARGTDYAFARPITRIVDGIHHTQSHHSRLLQLADIYTYTLSMLAGDCSEYPQSHIRTHISTKRNLYATKYKHWPPG
jgi:hypothetical protein